MRHGLRVARWFAALAGWAMAPLATAAAQPTTPTSRPTRAAAAPATPIARIGGVRCAASTASTEGTAPRLMWRGTTVRWAEWPVELGPSRVAARIVVATFSPRRTTLSLDIAREGAGLGAWTLEKAPPDALLAVNAGQFTDEGPWGWVVHNGREWQAPGSGTLAAAIAVDSSGAIAIVPAAAIGARRIGALREAVQSYPALLEQGQPSAALCGGSELDLTHRDTRLAIGVRRDGDVMVALSRYAGAGSGVSRVAERVPIGPTTPEMAEIMRRLGAVDALMLDGGLSAQLLVRSGTTVRRWPGLRAVPLALVVRAR
jgi:hypothetical protein